MISVSDRKENIVGKEENAGYQHFSPYPKRFSKAFFLRIVKNSGLLGIELNASNIEPMTTLIVLYY